MTWRVVARREVADLARSRAVRALVALVVAVALAGVVLPAVAAGDALAAADALAFLVAPLKVGVGLAALLVGAGAVASPRAGGQLKLVLGLPVARSSLVAGSFLGRAAVVLGGVALALAAAAGAIGLLHGSVPVAGLAGLAAVVALYAVAMVGLAVGLSAAVRTPGRATAAAVVAFVAFQFFWGVVPGSLHYVVEGTLPGRVVPAWVVLVERLQPLAAFEAAADLAVPSTDALVRVDAGGASSAEAAGPPTLAERLGGPPPGYLSPWAGVLTLVAWSLGPLAAGGYRFQRADL